MLTAGIESCRWSTSRLLSDERILSAIEERETLELLQALIRCPSENPPGNEAEKARCLAAYFECHGIDVELTEIDHGRPNATASYGDGQPTVILNGHIDTVPVGPGWTVDPFGAEIRDGFVYGRGAVDMLGGVAAMSAAVVALKRSAIELRGRVVVHAVVDEEVDSKGSKHAAKDVTADYVIVTEPTAGIVQSFGKGQLNVEIHFQGKAAHSSRPDLGRNAIHDAAAFIALVELENARIADTIHPGVGPATFSTGVISGGTSGSTVAAECVVTLDRRLLPTETLHEAQAHVERLVDQLAAERPGLAATVTPTLLFPAFPPVLDTRLAEVVQSVVRMLGISSGEVGGATGATDATWYASRGIPTVIFGPGQIETCHQPDECIAIDELHSGTRALALIVARLLRAGA